MSEADFRDVFHEHKNVVFRFVCRMTGSTTIAEDIVQDCFMALWRKPAAYDASRGKMRAFLLGIARNLVLKRWRHDRPHEALDDDAFVCMPLDVAGQERAEAVASAILTLPPLQREAVVLAEYEEMSLEEIAQATGADLAAVKSRLHRARQNLRRMLAPFLETKGVLHEPNDPQLRELLREWQTPEIPSSLEERVLTARQGWWSFLFHGYVRVPVPVVYALIVLMIFAGWRMSAPSTPSVPCVADCNHAVAGAC